MDSFGLNIHMILANQKKANLGENNYFSGCQEMDENGEEGGGGASPSWSAKTGDRPTTSCSFWPLLRVSSPLPVLSLLNPNETPAFMMIPTFGLQFSPSGSIKSLSFALSVFLPFLEGELLSPPSLSSVVCFSVLASEKDFSFP